GLCRRLLGNRADAEDAFQATFLVLVQKAGSLDQVRCLGSWLYKVAYHICLRAKARAASWARHVPLLPRSVATESPDPLADQELRHTIDRVLNDLPEKHRAPLILCYLQGKTHAEAARELGWPVGSMSRRVSQALERLRERLAHRQLALSAAVLAILASDRAVPVALAQATLKAAVLVNAGQAVGNAALPTGVVTL